MKNEQQFLTELRALADQAYRESDAIEKKANAELKVVASKIDEAVKASARKNGMPVRNTYVVVGRVGGRTAAISVNPY